MMTRCVPVTEASQVATARREAVARAEALALGAADVGRVALVSTELATNLLRHGGGGKLLVRALELDGGGPGVELMALDRGPGMPNVQECLRDGFSTGDTPGLGFGVVRRQSDEFDVYSLPGKGTGVLACLWSRQRRQPPGATSRHGSVSLAKSGEEVCGDGWAVAASGQKAVAMVVDGL